MGPSKTRRSSRLSFMSFYHYGLGVSTLNPEGPFLFLFSRRPKAAFRFGAGILGAFGFPPFASTQMGEESTLRDKMGTSNL